jgi:hypothetical protein
MAYVILKYGKPSNILLKNDFMKIMIMKEMDSVGKCKVYQVPFYIESYLYS